MKILIAAAALAGVSSIAAFTVPASAQSADMCQPLTSENVETCCAASDWSNIIRSEDQAYCPPSAEGDQVRLGRKFEEKNEGPVDAKDQSDVQENTGSVKQQQNNNNNNSNN